MTDSGFLRPDYMWDTAGVKPGARNLIFQVDGRNSTNLSHRLSGAREQEAVTGNQPGIEAL